MIVAFYECLMVLVAVLRKEDTIFCWCQGIGYGYQENYRSQMSYSLNGVVLGFTDGALKAPGRYITVFMEAALV